MKIVNLTRQSVDHRIEAALEQDPECADSRAFANPELQHKLTAYVLKRINNCYVAVEPEQEATLDGMINSELQCHQLDCLIRQGMNVLRQASADSIERHMLGADSLQIATEPSHWFG